MDMALARINIVAGMPAPGSAPTDEPGTALPATTTNFVKLLQEQGFEVDVAVPKADREYVDLNSAEVWLPILLFAAQPAWDMTILTLIGAIKSFYANREVRGEEDIDLPPGILHLKCSFERQDGSRKDFDGHGPAAEVVKALKKFGDLD